MQSMILAAITTSKKHNLMLDLTYNDKSHWSAKSRSKAPGHSACLKTIFRTITMQGLTLTVITALEKGLLSKFMTKSLERDIEAKSTGS